MKLFDVTNELVKSFRRIRSELNDPASINLRLRIVGARDTTSRQYELPTGSELEGLKRITSVHPKFDALHFPVLFPYGEDGFHVTIPYDPVHTPKTLKRKHVTQREYYAYRLQHRDDEGQTLMRGGKALQHYVVDAYSTIEQNRLYYLRSHQENLRSELYYGDAVGHVVLPSSHTGSPRYMKQLYLDAMAVVHHHGSPDLFITFTCNSQGLPHVHILLWLDAKNKLRQASDIDATVSAELPDPLLDPIGYDAVTKFMLHGPCGQDNPTNVCMKEGSCSKYFPKPFNSETTTDQFGYTVYRRRDTGITAVKGTSILDNRFIVPYNRNLLVLFQAHINVEVCHQGRLIKYLFKYITKGPDRKQRLSRILARDSVSETTLTQWFNLNQRDPTARDLLYAETPNRYIWNVKTKKWAPRKRGFSIGRIVYIHPGCGDTFYLRQLLTKVRGSVSYAALRTVHGFPCRTYQDACQRLGLLSNDDEWLLVIKEVSQWGMCRLLRTILAQLKEAGKIVLVVASSGIAATLLPDASTAHSRFKIPLEIDHGSSCNIKKGTPLAQLIINASLIIWDEAPMVHRLSFEAVNRAFCDIMDVPFDFSGDSLHTDASDPDRLEAEYPTEFLNSLSFNGCPEHQIDLKVFAPIMLLRNLNPSIGLCNGTRLMVLYLGHYVIKGMIMGGTFNGKTVAIPRIVLSVNDYRWPFVLKRRQFPVRLCYAMTINKSQGQTLQNVGVYLPKPVFSHGQLYVAVSRVRTPDGLRFLILNEDGVPSNCTRNIVYQEAFVDLQTPSS
ncbi:unnamed protein product [Linum tenue]|uniref:ATP-dependent DNA helicase n=1 Tax=Linum tenue TaxID=586396 RepID=A0AAV0N4I8_9ROSI|nr:unnamed protein product [Linum tenue]CAI0410146.1 unnamed protein product [Linum tenue]CAI0410216.1 unnamed protein product [Linum tenue]CAI0412110.1 unnamed protein product [Linum tenue]CAI0417388.1 unnamed protein product [Linum tenue]